MRIAVLGTGSVGRTLAGRLDEVGHDVVIGTRDVMATMRQSESDQMGNPPYASWADDHPSVRLATFADAVDGSDLVVNATNGAASQAVLDAVGADRLGDKVLVDVSNPLDFSRGFPPSLSVCNTESLGEQLQAAFPRVRVVKTLNTLNAALMTHPEHLADGGHSVFVSGDDTEAKRTVVELLTSLGHRDVIDLGDITTARGPEMYLPLWLRLMSALGTSEFSINVVR